MTVAVGAYDGTTALGPIDDAFDVEWVDPINEPGAGSFRIAADAPSVGFLDYQNICRIAVDGTDRFAFVIESKGWEHDDAGNLIMRVGGRNVLALLDHAAIYHEGGLNTSGGDERPFGFMNAAFDDAAWGAASAKGTQATPDNPGWEDNPQAWPDPSAYWIWTETALTVPPGFAYFRKTLTLAAPADVKVFASADDEFTVWIDNEVVLEATGPFQWTRTHEEAMSLAAGDHTVAIRGRNLLRPSGDSPAAVLLSIFQASSDGSPVVVNETQEVYNDAGLNEIQQVYNNSTTGTFTLSFGGNTTGNIAYNASAATVEGALEALPDITDVAVSGSGTSADPWIIEFLDPGKQDVATLTADDTGMDGTTTITTTQQGGNGGTFTLTFDGQTTAAIDWNASAATVEGSLEALSNIDDVSVSGRGRADDPWVVEFIGNAVKAQDLPLMTADDTNLVGDTVGTTITETTKGARGKVLLRTDATWKAVGYPDPPPGLTPGEVVGQLISEAQTRGPLADVTTGFTDSVDSSATAWPDTVDFGFQIGSTYLWALEQLAELAVDIHMNPNLQLDMWFQRGTDRSASITFTLDTNLTGASWSGSGRIRNVILARSSFGWAEYQDSPSLVSYDRAEAYLSIGTVQVDASQHPVDAAFDMHAMPSVEGNLHLDGTVVPYVDFNVGDWVTATDPEGTTSRFRVLSIAGRQTSADHVDWSLEVERD